MKKEFSPETINIILDQDGRDEAARRTPLHVDFDSDSSCAPSKEIVLGLYSDPESFNAIGSRNPYEEGHHHPVLDVDGGVATQRDGRKVILAAAKPGTYQARSLLRDVLGDNGIDLEPFPLLPRLSESMGFTHIHNRGIGAIVLRSTDIGMFEAVDSTTKGHGHLYIQQYFNREDHRTLISELATIGIVSERWAALTEQEGMSIVRTPWTEKEVTHTPS